MASRRRSGARATKKLHGDLRQYIRTVGRRFLDDANITSIGVGYKVTRGRTTRQISLQFTVRKKGGAAGVGLEELDTQELPRSIFVAGTEVPTDVLERDYQASFQAVKAEQTDPRKLRSDPLVPGVSVSHPDGTAGTLGLVVYDRTTGAPCMLSNWHVLHRAAGQIGDDIVQPGPHDDNNLQANHAGRLTRSHLGEAGDCAIARIEDRDFVEEILDLGVRPTSFARVELGDRVVKSGRTTGVTHGRVRRVDVIARIHYTGMGERLIGGFEYGPEPDAPPDFEVSMGGDSGSAVLLARTDGEARPILAGLHFAGETVGNPDEHGIACYAHAVFKKLNITLEKPASDEIEVIDLGYDSRFLKERVRVPWLSTQDYADAVKLDDYHLIPYTHFSVCLSKKRGLPRFAAWNVDGGRIKTVSRNGLRFRLDPRVEREHQHGNELYSNNLLDRGHIARRASLCWGSLTEARQANKDSFFYTNIAPQHEAFNRSNLGGLWGRLENAVFEDVEVKDLKISVIGGPVFRDSDPEHRGVKIPRDYWKLVAFTDSADDTFKVRAFLLSQRDLLSDLEALELDPFRMFQVSLQRLGDETGMDFSRLDDFDTQPEALGVESVPGASPVREIRQASDLVL